MHAYPASGRSRDAGASRKGRERPCPRRISRIRVARTAEQADETAGLTVIQANTSPDANASADNHLYIYAIVRADLEMPAGKLAAQAGHAYTDALFDCLDKDPGRAVAYRRDGIGGSKVTLQAKNEHALRRAHREAIEAGLPCALVVDQNHVLLPHFDGSPVVTALGIGPCTKEEARHVAKRFNCVKDDKSAAVARILVDATALALSHLQTPNVPGVPDRAGTSDAESVQDRAPRPCREARAALERGLASVEALTGKPVATAR